MGKELITADAARDRALAVLKANEGQLVFVRPEDLECQKMFIPQTVVLRPTRGDFHEKPIEGKYMPQTNYADAMAEASGITFIAAMEAVTKISEFVWVGKAQGKKRLPDGTWRDSHLHEYEYDAEKRAEEVVLKNPEKYANDATKRLNLLQTAKFGRQRASTGARLKVIRELAHVPIGFSPTDFQKAMVFSRVELNTDQLLADPQMRDATIRHAIGAKATLFGPDERNVTPPPKQLTDAQIEGAEDLPEEEVPSFELEPDNGQGEPEADPRIVEARKVLQQYLDDNKYDMLGKQPKEGRSARETIADLLAAPDVTLEELLAMEERVQKYLKKVKGGAS